jgi:hypothetical protein
MPTHPSDPQSPGGEASVRRSLRESMNIPKASPPADDEAEQTAAGAEDPEEAARIQGENEQLRSIVDELRQQLDHAVSEAQSGMGERGREYEAMLEQKTDTIRELHLRLQQLEQGGGSGAEPGAEDGPGSVNQEELSALSDEIERERCQLEQERRRLEEDRKQLRDDEESMLRQMRDMEIQMAKERAELARQRNELQRLHSEIRHELELAQRDAAVNERLRMLTRRSNAEGQASGSSGETAAAGKKKRTILATPAAESKKDKKKGSGFFGRLFGK